MTKACLRHFITIALIISTYPLYAQSDVAGCEDHVLLDRVQGYHIERCSQEERPLMVATGKKKQVEVKGKSSTISYYGHADHLPNGYYLIKRYEKTIKARGGEKLFWDNGNSGNKPRATFRLKEGEREYWITLTNFRGVATEGVDAYDLTVIETTY